mmetsp:Transcript_1815/g.5296  ORF Transcript_1815/g.5296 Transcript_1815/m.5296 type:complete len:260 (+) Transcript_1815:1184-1963(+)
MLGILCAGLLILVVVAQSVENCVESSVMNGHLLHRGGLADSCRHDANGRLGGTSHHGRQSIAGRFQAHFGAGFFVGLRYAGERGDRPGQCLIGDSVNRIGGNIHCPATLIQLTFSLPGFISSSKPRHHHLPVVYIGNQNHNNKAKVHPEECGGGFGVNTARTKSKEHHHDGDCHHDNVPNQRASTRNAVGGDHNASHDHTRNEHTRARQGTQTQLISVRGILGNGIDRRRNIRRAIAQCQERHASEPRRETHLEREHLQ